MIFQRLKESLYFWWRHLAALFLISAPFALLGEASQWLLGPFVVSNAEGQLAGLNLPSILTLLLIRPLAEGALIMQLAAIHNGRWRGLIACTLPALALYPLLLATYFFMAVGVSLGWMLLFFPAFWVYTRLSFAPFRVLLLRESPLAAMRGAFLQSARCQWPLLGAIVMCGALVFTVVGLTSGLMVGLLGDNPGTMLVTTLVASLAATLVNIVVFRFWLLFPPTPAEAA